MSVAIYICYDFTSVDRDINNAMRCPLKRLSWIVIGSALIAFAFYMYIQPYSSADENKKSFIHSYDGRKHEMVELRRRYPSLNRVSFTDPPLQETNWKPAQRNDLNMTPLVFLSTFKNPCWYEWTNPGVYRRYSWTKQLCSERTRPIFCDTLINESQHYESIRILRCLPYFMLIGQPKCGSTDLFQRIEHHPDVVKSRSKESHWWTRNRHSKCPYSFTEYVDTFSRVASRLQSSSDDADHSAFLTGDGSVSTLWDEEWWMSQNPENRTGPSTITAHYIRHILPNVKLVVILRNPVERLYSEYLYFKREQNKSSELFHDVVQEGLQAFHTCLAQFSLRFCAYKGNNKVRLHIGLYVVYLTEWMAVYPRDQFLIIPLEFYSNHMQESMSAVYRFLDLRDISAGWKNTSTPRNARHYSDQSVGDMWTETRQLLIDFYQPYNTKLARLLRDQRFLWPE